MVSDGDRNFYLLAASGCEVNETHMELFYGAEDLQHARELLEDIPPHCQKILLGIAASDLNKKYPVEKYWVALNELAKRDLIFIIVGGREEIAEANFIEQGLPRGKVINLAGKTTLRETEAVISLADCYIGHDTGIMHMAATAKLPVLVLYREAADRENILPPILSGFGRFPPWQTKSVILRPAHPLDDCATLPPVHGHCHHLEAHCITQIPPHAIIEGFDKLMTL